MSKKETKESLEKKINNSWKLLTYCGIVSLCLGIFFIAAYFVNGNIEDGISNLNILGTQLTVAVMDIATRSVPVVIVSILFIIVCSKKKSTAGWFLLVELLFLTDMFSSTGASLAGVRFSPMLSDSLKNLVSIIEGGESIAAIVGLAMIIGFIRLRLLEKKQEKLSAGNEK